MASQRDVKNKIASVKNIQKITRALETVAAARLRRAEQRIEALRPYADAVRRMTRQAAQAAGAEASRLPLLAEHDAESNVGVLLVTGDRGLAGGFNSQIIRAGIRLGTELGEEGKAAAWYADRPPRRLLADVPRTRAERQLHRLLRPPRLRRRPHDRRRPDRRLRRRQARPRRAHLQRLRLAADPDRDPGAAAAGLAATVSGEDEEQQGEAQDGPRALVDYEPDPEAILRRLVPDYVEISIYRALVESTAGFFGAQMTAMRSASENAGEIITDYTLEMNRARQAEITQEIMEVVAGAEGLS